MLVKKKTQLSLCTEEHQVQLDGFLVSLCSVIFLSGGWGHVKYLQAVKEPGENSSEEKDSCILQRPCLTLISLHNASNTALYSCKNKI